MKHYTKEQLYSILDWHTAKGYDIQCTWQYHDEGGHLGVLLEWHDPVRQLEYWLTVDKVKV